jgi:hypothetical protein
MFMNLLLFWYSDLVFVDLFAPLHVILWFSDLVSIDLFVLLHALFWYSNLVFVKLFVELVLPFLLVLLWFLTLVYIDFPTNLFCLGLNLSSFTFIGRSIVFNTTSLKPKNSKQSCNCSSTLVIKYEIHKKHYKDWTIVLISTYM